MYVDDNSRRSAWIKDITKRCYYLIGKPVKELLHLFWLLKQSLYFVSLELVIILCCFFFVGLQHKSLAQCNDYRWNSTDKEMLSTGPGPAVLWMFYIQNVLVSILLLNSLENWENLGNSNFNLHVAFYQKNKWNSNCRRKEEKVKNNEPNSINENPRGWVVGGLFICLFVFLFEGRMWDINVLKTEIELVFFQKLLLLNAVVCFGTWKF